MLNAKLVAHYPGLEMQCSASCFDLILDDSGVARVRYATAAHPPLQVIHGGVARAVYQPGPFLGVVGEIELDPVELEISPGDRLLIYSDGLEEQRNAGREEFGLDRVVAPICNRDADLATAVNRVVKEWTGFVGEQHPDDDATLIAVEHLRKG
jgi:sigma-B regulation protein RsbU (phosphoserine phosphatase)